jgi:hypothetical protein
VQGDEDFNDHDYLRHDSMLGIAVGQLEGNMAMCASCGESILNHWVSLYF